MSEEPQVDPMLIWREFSRRLRLAQDSIEPALHEAGVHSHAEFDALELLARDPEGQRPQRTVQESLGLSQSGTSRLVSRLERAGLVRRVSSTSDARAAELLVTPEGHEVVARNRLAFEERVRSALSSLASALVDPVLLGTLTGTARDIDTAAAPGGLLQFGESLLALGSEAVTVADAIHVRDALEPLVLIEAAQYRTTEDIADCDAILATMASLLDDGKRFYKADWSLHRRLAQICRNGLLRTVYVGLLATLEGHVDDVVPTEGLRDYLRRRVVVHTEIIDAIASGRIDRVRAAANAHAITGLSSAVGAAS